MTFIAGRKRRYRMLPSTSAWPGEMVEMTAAECAAADRAELDRDKSNDLIVVDVDEATGTITLGRR